MLPPESNRAEAPRTNTPILADCIQQTKLSRLFADIYGIDVKDDRCASPFCYSTNPRSVSIDDVRGAWKDHASGKGGGFLNLIRDRFNYSRAESAQWLASHHGQTLQPFDRRQIERHKQSTAASREILGWRDLLTLFL